MPRLTADKWQEARAYYEAGASQQATADKFGVSKTAVQKKIENEGWTQDLEEAVRRKVAAKVAGVLPGATIEQKAAAVDAEAERRVAVNRRHEKLWDQATALQQQAINKAVGEDGKVIFIPDPALQRAAKLNADTVAVIVAGERKVYRLDETGAGNEAPPEVRFVRRS